MKLEPKNVNLKPGRKVFQERCIGRVCQQLQGTRGDQGAQTELRNPGSVGSNSNDESNNKGIDMQSFGAMTGADPLAVKEIEQLMFNS